MNNTAKFMETDGGVCAAKGFKATGVEAGIKNAGRKDMAMLFCEVPCAAAGTFTSNVVKAAPVLWDREIVKNTATARGIVINSGIANACTGREGMEICEKLAEATGKALGVKADEILICSTGVIGMQLPLEKMCEALPALADRLDSATEAGNKAARAIMTTDTKPKERSYRVALGGKTVTIGAMCKGSGMIAPNMCTMLCFITTDADIAKELLQKALSEAADRTFNMVSVDGDTSTNDTVLLLANGEAKNTPITEENDDYLRFKEALMAICRGLAREIAADGEGATKLITASVEGAASEEDAKRLAKSVISSSLVKAAMYGADANWGRILCALGYADAVFDPEKAEVGIESAAGRLMLYRGEPVKDIDEAYATKILKEKEVILLVHCHQGEGSAEAWGCDLTHEYVNINADYRS